MRKTLPLLFLTVLILGSVPTYADDGSYSESGGGAASPMTPNSSIRMVRERIDIRLGQKGAVVKCVFVFKNEGAACSVQMGFPESQRAIGEGSLSGGLDHFVSFVDGKTAKVTHRFPPEGHSFDNNQRRDYTSWYVKTVKFTAGQTRTVEDDYFSRYGTSYYLGGTDVPQELFRYVLVTGVTWKGPIGVAVINVDASHMDSTRDIDLPKGCVKVGAHKWTWTAKNIEPKEDFKITLRPRYPLFNGQRIDGGRWARLQDRYGVIMVGCDFIKAVGGSSVIDDGKHTCTMKYNGHALVMKEGSRTAKFDNSAVILPISIEMHPRYFSGCEVPLATVVKLFGGSLSLDRTTGRLSVKLKDRRTEEQRRDDTWGLK
ncbi:MAG TPA: hypothetical protein VGK34_08430 [Armatimonadota bacterium]